MLKFKIVSLVLIIAIFTVLLVPCVALAIMTGKSTVMMDDISNIASDERYSEALYIENVPLVTQKISCGYAVMEMFAKHIGVDLSEQSLFDEYGKVVTSTGRSFAKEMNKRFRGYKTTMHRYLASTDLIDKVYNSLKAGMPVPFEWAAKLDDVWTLHYSLLVGLDVRGDKVSVLNPYGYQEELSIKDFIDRTSFNAFSPMGFGYLMGFAFGMFEKNTIFVVEQA